MTEHPGNWLNPLRRDCAERLLHFIQWHGGNKLFLDAERYADLHVDTGMDRYAVDLAADDLYALGCITIRQKPGAHTVLEVLSWNLDGASDGPKSALTPASAPLTPNVVVSRSGRSGWK
jgi:hypothetical protein